MKHISLILSMVLGVCFSSISLAASEEGAASAGFSFDARTLKLGTWLDDYQFDGFKASGNNGIIDTHGFTSDAEKTVAMLDIQGFKVMTPAKIEILMSNCHDCDIELRSKGSLICSARQGGDYIDFENTGFKKIGKGKNATHVFEMSDKSIRLTSNNTFINARRVEVDSIDQIIIRGLKRENVDTGRSHVFQVSAKGKPAEKKEPEQGSAQRDDKDYGRESAEKEEKGYSRKSAGSGDKDSGGKSGTEKKTDSASRVLDILTE